MNAGARLYEEAAKTAAKGVRTLVTPEGAALNVKLASIGDRFGALVLDVLFIFLAIAAFGLFMAWVGSLGVPTLALIVWLLVFFGVRFFYFVYFEIAWRGATPGKRIVGVRVVDRGGAALTKEAVLARNFLREIELFLPMTLLLSGAGFGLGALISLAIFIWIVCLLIVPFINKDRMRAGDIVGGTLVIRQPKPILMEDLAASQTADGFAFTREHLAHYGAFELQTLEALLRRPPGPVRNDTMAAVHARIAAKIGWTRAEPSTEAFLRAYYRALREHLERQALFGLRKKHKHDEPQKPTAPEG